MVPIRWLVTRIVVPVLVLSACDLFELGDPGPQLEIFNDTDRPVTISFIRNGVETAPYRQEEARVNASGSERYDMLSISSFDVKEGEYCTDDEIVARYDDGTEIRILPSTCSRYLLLTDYATAFVVTNDTDLSLRLWVEHGGDLFTPLPGDPELEPGESGRYALKDAYSARTAEGEPCIDGELSARPERGADLFIPPPVCNGDEIELSDFVSDP